MQPYVTAENIKEHVGEEVVLRGWVYNRTHKGKLVFLLIRDGAGSGKCPRVFGAACDRAAEQCGEAGYRSAE